MDLGAAGVTGRARNAVLESRFRVFSALVEATGENLATLQRAEAQDASSGYGRGCAPAGGLMERFGLYSDADAAGSIWPRQRLLNAKPDPAVKRP